METNNDLMDSFLVVQASRLHHKNVSQLTIVVHYSRELCTMETASVVRQNWANPRRPLMGSLHF